MKENIKYPTINGQQYQREASTIGDTEIITWSIGLKTETVSQALDFGSYFYNVIRNQDVISNLEDTYEAICLEDMTPKFFFI